MLRKSLIFFAFIPCTLIGCAHVQSNSTNISKLSEKPVINEPRYVTNPQWLLIGGVDVDSKEMSSPYHYKAVTVKDNTIKISLTGGGTIRSDLSKGAYIYYDDIVSTSRLIGLNNYDIIGTPEITFSFRKGGKIIYWNGKGEIKNNRTGEIVKLPREK